MREALAEIFEDSDGEEEDKLQRDLQGKKERYSGRLSEAFFSLDGNGKEQG